MALGLHMAVARSGVTFVDAISVRNNAMNTKSYFLQTIMFHVLTKLLKKGYGAKKFIAYSLTVRQHVRAVADSLPLGRPHKKRCNYCSHWQI